MTHQFSLRSNSGLPLNVSMQDTYLPDSELESDFKSASEREFALWRHCGFPLNFGTPTHPRARRAGVDSEPEYLDDDSITPSDLGDPDFWEVQTSTEDPKLKEMEAEFARQRAALFPTEENKPHHEQMKQECDKGMQLLHERLATLKDEQEMVVARAQEEEEEEDMEESEL